MKLVTWNVNSVRVRLAQVQEFLRQNQPDMLVMQEIKCETSAFPALEFHGLGYTHQLVLGQKAYNGVALLSRHPLEDTRLGLVTPDEPQARYLEATIQGVRVAGLYAPNGQPADGPAPGSEKYHDKLAWLDRLIARAQILLEMDMPVAMMGDFNIIPQSRDVTDPQVWQDHALFHIEARRRYRALLNQGWTDSLRALHPQDNHLFTFWDYQDNAFARDDGLRIDHVLLSPEAADRLSACMVERATREGERPSDHAAVSVVLADAPRRD